MLARMLPVLPVIGAKSRLQPIYVGDARRGDLPRGRGPGEGRQDLRDRRPGGRDQASWWRVLTDTPAHQPAAAAAGWAWPSSWRCRCRCCLRRCITGDQVDQLQADNVVSDAAEAQRTLAAFGIAPTAMDAILPSYLWRFCEERPVRPPNGVCRSGVLAQKPIAGGYPHT